MGNDMELTIKVNIIQYDGTYENSEIAVIASTETPIGKIHQRESFFIDLTEDNVAEKLENYLSFVVDKIRKRKETAEANMKLLTEIAGRYHAKLIVEKV